MVFITKKTILYVVELTVPFQNIIQKAHDRDRKAKKYTDLVSDILNNGFTCDLTSFEMDHVDSLPLKTTGTSKKSSLLLIPVRESQLGAFCP